MKFLSEPMIQFLAGGALLFGANAWIAAGRDALPEDRTKTLHIGSGEVAWLQEAWTRQWQRPATRDEMIGLVTTYLKEELLAREARALGLEEHDTLVRRRLAQKLSFLLEDTFRLAEASDAELEAYFRANASRYQTEGRISLIHLFFDPEKRQDALADAAAALTLLAAAVDDSAVAELGDRLLIGPEIRDADEKAVAAQFGEEFAEAVFALPAGPWEGPIRSAYGVHLVRVDEKSEAQPLSFAESLPELREDWYRDRQRQEVERYFSQLMQRYRVEVDADVRGMIGPLDELLPQTIGGASETR